MMEKQASLGISHSSSDDSGDTDMLLGKTKDPEEGHSGNIVPRSNAIEIQFATRAEVSRDHCPCCPMSLPVDFYHNCSRIPTEGIGIPYGSLPGMVKEKEVAGGSTKVTYCVHGKPGGCCATVVDGGSKKPPRIDIPVDEHCHQDRITTVDKKARRKLIIASILCVIFMIAEIIGGYLSGSLAIATDAAHLLTDFASFMISLFAIWVAQRKPSRLMPFGWHRAEVIGALTSVLTIWVVTGVLVYMAVERCINLDFEINALLMLITSAIGVVVNLIMGATLHQHGPRGHSHGHGHEGTPATGQKNINVRAAFIHVLGDLLQSIGVLIAAIIIFFKPEWKIVDPICTFLFSILVLLTTYSIVRDALIVLMEGIPRDVDFADVLNTFLCIEGVVRVHNLRIWALSLDKMALSAHLAIDPKASSTEILKVASRKIHTKYNFFEMTLQIEEFQVKMESCDQCQVP